MNEDIAVIKRDQIDRLVAHNDELMTQIEDQEALINKLKWFCLKLSIGVTKEEMLLTQKVASKLLNTINVNAELVSFEDFIGVIEL